MEEPNVKNDYQSEALISIKQLHQDITNEKDRLKRKGKISRSNSMAYLAIRLENIKKKIEKID